MSDEKEGLTALSERIEAIRQRRKEKVDAYVRRYLEDARSAHLVRWTLVCGGDVGVATPSEWVVGRERGRRYHVITPFFRRESLEISLYWAEQRALRLSQETLWSFHVEAVRTVDCNQRTWDLIERAAILIASGAPALRCER